MNSGSRLPIAYTWQDKSWLLFRTVPVTACISKPLQLSKQSSLKHGVISETLPGAAALQLEAQFPSDSPACFYKMVTAVVAISKNALGLTSVFLKMYKNLACFRNVVYPLSVLCQTICSENFKGQVIGCSKGMFYRLAMRKSSV